MKKAKLNQEPNKTESSSEQSEDEDGDNSGEDSTSSFQLNKCDSYDEKKPSDQNQSDHVTEENQQMKQQIVQLGTNNFNNHEVEN